MGLIKFVNEVTPKRPSTEVDVLLEEYPDVFEGLRCLEGTAKLQIDLSVTPVAVDLQYLFWEIQVPKVTIWHESSPGDISKKDA